ncbi:MAG: hypothetical protein U0936_21745 [Planctomycetaceae bacterium]
MLSRIVMVPNGYLLSRSLFVQEARIIWEVSSGILLTRSSSSILQN